MTRRVFCIKAGTWASSPIPTLQASTAYSIGDVVKAQSPYFAQCVTAGTSGGSAGILYPTGASDPDTQVAHGSTLWKFITGEDGFVANSWDIAGEDMITTCNTTYGGAAGNHRNGKFYTLREGSIIYVDKAQPLSGMPTFYEQFTDVTELLYGGAPNQSNNPVYPASRVKIWSSDAGAYPLAYSKGLVFNWTDSYPIVGLGRNEFRGIVFNTNSSVAYWSPSAYGTSILYDNTRMMVDNIFVDCDITLGVSAAKEAFPAWVMGMLTENLDSEKAAYVFSRGTCYTYAGFIDCNIKINHNQGRVILLCDTDISGCTFSSDEGAMPSGGFIGLSRHALPTTSVYDPGLHQYYSTNTGDIKITLKGCTFSTKLSYLFTPEVLGRVKIELDGCEFPSGTDLTKLLDNISPATVAHMQVDLVGCGVTGGIDAYSHVYLTPRVSAAKVNSPYRTGGLQDRNGSAFSYYCKSKEGLQRYAYPEELPHLSRAISVGVYEVTLHIATPVLLAADELFIYLICPDSGNSDWVENTITKSTERVANFYSSKPASIDSPVYNHLGVAEPWVGLPVGWQTQKVSMPVKVYNAGRVYCIPWIAKNRAEFIICPTLDIKVIENV